MAGILHGVFTACFVSDDRSLRSRFFRWGYDHNLEGKTEIYNDDRLAYTRSGMYNVLFSIRRSDLDFLYVTVQNNYWRPGDKVIICHGTGYTLYYEEYHGKVYTSKYFDDELQHILDNYPSLFDAISGGEFDA